MIYHYDYMELKKTIYVIHFTYLYIQMYFEWLLNFGTLMI